MGQWSSTTGRVVPAKAAVGDVRVGRADVEPDGEIDVVAGEVEVLAVFGVIAGVTGLSR
jgi:hypothetical protein